MDYKEALKEIFDKYKRLEEKNAKEIAEIESEEKQMLAQTEKRKKEKAADATSGSGGMISAQKLTLAGVIERNEQILKRVETSKAILRSRTTFSPVEVALQKARANFYNLQDMPTTTTTTKKFDLPTIVKPQTLDSECVPILGDATSTAMNRTTKNKICSKKVRFNLPEEQEQEQQEREDKFWDSEKYMKLYQELKEKCQKCEEKLKYLENKQQKYFNDQVKYQDYKNQYLKQKEIHREHVEKKRQEFKDKQRQHEKKYRKHRMQHEEPKEKHEEQNEENGEQRRDQHEEEDEEQVKEDDVLEEQHEEQHGEQLGEQAKEHEEQHGEQHKAHDEHHEEHKKIYQAHNKNYRAHEKNHGKVEGKQQDFEDKSRMFKGMEQVRQPHQAKHEKIQRKWEKTDLKNKKNQREKTENHKIVKDKQREHKKSHEEHAQKYAKHVDLQQNHEDRYKNYENMQKEHQNHQKEIHYHTKHKLEHRDPKLNHTEYKLNHREHLRKNSEHVIEKLNHEQQHNDEDKCIHFETKQRGHQIHKPNHLEHASNHRVQTLNHRVHTLNQREHEYEQVEHNEQRNHEEKQQEHAPNHLDHASNHRVQTLNHRVHTPNQQEAEYEQVEHKEQRNYEEKHQEHAPNHLDHASNHRVQTLNHRAHTPNQREAEYEQVEHKEQRNHEDHTLNYGEHVYEEVNHEHEQQDHYVGKQDNEEQQQYNRYRPIDLTGIQHKHKQQQRGLENSCKVNEGTQRLNQNQGYLPREIENKKSKYEKKRQQLKEHVGDEKEYQNRLQLQKDKYREHAHKRCEHEYNQKEHENLRLDRKMLEELKVKQRQHAEPNVKRHQMHREQQQEQYHCRNKHQAYEEKLGKYEKKAHDHKNQRHDLIGKHKDYEYHRHDNVEMQKESVYQQQKHHSNENKQREQQNKQQKHQKLTEKCREYQIKQSEIINNHCEHKENQIYYEQELKDMSVYNKKVLKDSQLCQKQAHEVREMREKKLRYVDLKRDHNRTTRAPHVDEVENLKHETGLRFLHQMQEFKKRNISKVNVRTIGHKKNIRSIKKSTNVTKKLHRATNFLKMEPKKTIEHNKLVGGIKKYSNASINLHRATSCQKIKPQSRTSFLKSSVQTIGDNKYVGGIKSATNVSTKLHRATSFLKVEPHKTIGYNKMMGGIKKSSNLSLKLHRATSCLKIEPHNMTSFLKSSVQTIGHNKTLRGITSVQSIGIKSVDAVGIRSHYSVGIKHLTETLPSKQNRGEFTDTSAAGSTLQTTEHANYISRACQVPSIKSADSLKRASRLQELYQARKTPKSNILRSSFPAYEYSKFVKKEPEKVSHVFHTRQQDNLREANILKSSEQANMMTKKKIEVISDLDQSPGSLEVERDNVRYVKIRGTYMSVGVQQSAVAQKSTLQANDASSKQPMRAVHRFDTHQSVQSRSKESTSKPIEEAWESIPRTIAIYQEEAESTNPLTKSPEYDTLTPRTFGLDESFQTTNASTPNSSAVSMEHSEASSSYRKSLNNQFEIAARISISSSSQSAEQAIAVSIQTSRSSGEFSSSDEYVTAESWHIETSSRSFVINEPVNNMQGNMSASSVRSTVYEKTEQATEHSSISNKAMKYMIEKPVHAALPLRTSDIDQRIIKPQMNVQKRSENANRNFRTYQGAKNVVKKEVQLAVRLSGCTNSKQLAKKSKKCKSEVTEQKMELLEQNHEHSEQSTIRSNEYHKADKELSAESEHIPLSVKTFTIDISPKNQQECKLEDIEQEVQLLEQNHEHSEQVTGHSREYHRADEELNVESEHIPLSARTFIIDISAKNQQECKLEVTEPEMQLLEQNHEHSEQAAEYQRADEELSVESEHIPLSARTFIINTSPRNQKESKSEATEQNVTVLEQNNEPATVCSKEYNSVDINETTEAEHLALSARTYTIDKSARKRQTNISNSSERGIEFKIAHNSYSERAERHTKVTESGKSSIVSRDEEAASLLLRTVDINKGNQKPLANTSFHAVRSDKELEHVTQTTEKLAIGKPVQKPKTSTALVSALAYGDSEQRHENLQRNQSAEKSIIHETHQATGANIFAIEESIKENKAKMPHKSEKSRTYDDIEASSTDKSEVAKKAAGIKHSTKAISLIRGLEGIQKKSGAITPPTEICAEPALARMRKLRAQVMEILENPSDLARDKEDWESTSDETESAERALKFLEMQIRKAATSSNWSDCKTDTNESDKNSKASMFEDCTDLVARCLSTQEKAAKNIAAQMLGSFEPKIEPKANTFKGGSDRESGNLKKVEKKRAAERMGTLHRHKTAKSARVQKLDQREWGTTPDNTGQNLNNVENKYAVFGINQRNKELIASATKVSEHIAGDMGTFCRAKKSNINKLERVSQATKTFDIEKAVKEHKANSYTHLISGARFVQETEDSLQQSASIFGPTDLTCERKKIILKEWLRKHEKPEKLVDEQVSLDLEAIDITGQSKASRCSEQTETVNINLPAEKLKPKISKSSPYLRAHQKSLRTLNAKLFETQSKAVVSDDAVGTRETVDINPPAKKLKAKISRGAVHLSAHNTAELQSRTFDITEPIKVNLLEHTVVGSAYCSAQNLSSDKLEHISLSTATIDINRTGREHKANVSNTAEHKMSIKRAKNSSAPEVEHASATFRATDVNAIAKEAKVKTSKQPTPTTENQTEQRKSLWRAGRLKAQYNKTEKSMIAVKSAQEINSNGMILKGNSSKIHEKEQSHLRSEPLSPAVVLGGSQVSVEQKIAAESQSIYSKGSEKSCRSKLRMGVIETKMIEDSEQAAEDTCGQQVVGASISDESSTTNTRGYQVIRTSTSDVSRTKNIIEDSEHVIEDTRGHQVVGVSTTDMSSTLSTIADSEQVIEDTCGQQVVGVSTSDESSTTNTRGYQVIRASTSDVSRIKNIIEDSEDVIEDTRGHQVVGVPTTDVSSTPSTIADSEQVIQDTCGQQVVGTSISDESSTTNTRGYQVIRTSTSDVSSNPSIIAGSEQFVEDKGEQQVVRSTTSDEPRTTEHPTRTAVVSEYTRLHRAGQLISTNVESTEHPPRIAVVSEEKEQKVGTKAAKKKSQANLAEHCIIDDESNIPEGVTSALSIIQRSPTLNLNFMKSSEQEATIADNPKYAQQALEASTLKSFEHNTENFSIACSSKDVNIWLNPYSTSHSLDNTIELSSGSVKLENAVTTVAHYSAIETNSWETVSQSFEQSTNAQKLISSSPSLATEAATTKISKVKKFKTATTQLFTNLKRKFKKKSN